LILVLFGPPGCGKGTQADLLKQKYNLAHLAMGDILRQEVAGKTSLGEKVAAFLTEGKLVPDQLTSEVFFNKLVEIKSKKGFIFDGFPRTVAQAQALDKFLVSNKKQIDFAVYFKLSLEILVARLVGRRSCPQCGRIYHIKTKPPLDGKRCDQCKIDLISRNDDKEETIKMRFINYQNFTLPLINYYRDKNILKEINADAPIDSIFEILSKFIYD
jgi:adenylate kinase